MPFAYNIAKKLSPKISRDCYLWIYSSSISGRDRWKCEIFVESTSVRTGQQHSVSAGFEHIFGLDLFVKLSFSLISSSFGPHFVFGCHHYVEIVVFEME